MNSDRVVLSYKEDEEKIELGRILVNHSISVDEAINILDINLDEVATINGWDDWKYESLKLEWESNIEKIAKIAEIYGVVMDAQNASQDDYTEVYHKIIDDYEEYNVLNEEYIGDFKKATLRAAKYCGYTNIQYDILDRVKSLIEEI